MVETSGTLTWIFRKGNQGILILATIALLGAGQGCAPSRPVIPPDHVHVLTEQTPFGRTMTLEELIRQALSHQYPLPGIVFPEQDGFGQYHIEVVHEPVVLHLANGVRTFQAGPRSEMKAGSPNPVDAGLAAGLENGDIRIWSSWPCPYLTLPSPTPVSILAWDGTGPFLGAGGEDGKNELHVFDLRYCAQVATIAGERTLRAAALSSSLTWVALVEIGGRLHVGSVEGPLQHLATLRYPPLAVQFSPREGLLQSIDQAGWLLIWSLPDLDLVEQRHIPGGPFDAAMFHDNLLALRIMEQDRGLQDEFEASGSQRFVVWNIPEMRMLEEGDSPSFPFRVLDHPFNLIAQLDLESGMLTYRTSDAHWLRKLHFGAPRMEAHVSEDEGLLRISDIDQVQRWYSLRSGLPVNDPSADPGDLRPLPMDRGARVRWAGVEYALADPVLVRDGRLLLARHLPDKRFFLWWADVEQGLPVSLPDGGLLPIRDSLLLEHPPRWILFPADPAAGKQAPGSP